MRKEISSLFRFKANRTRVKVFWGLILVALFIIANGALIYIFNFSGFYFYAVKKIIPYPAFVVGSKIVTFSYYDDQLSVNQKIYETAYRTNFTVGQDGKDNLDLLKENVKNKIIDRLIMEKLLNSEKVSVTTTDINNEYNSMLSSIGSDKEILNILKYSSGIEDSDIKDLIYQNLLKDRVTDDFIYNLKMQAIVIKPNDVNNNDDWNNALQKSQAVYIDILTGNSSFAKYQTSYGDPNDPIIQNLGRPYYFAEDFPDNMKDSFYALGMGINKPIKGDNGYYIFNVTEERGIYKGTYDDFMKEQAGKIRILSFVR